MTSIAHLDTTALDTAAKFFRTMQKVGADFTGPLQSVAQRRNLTDYLQMGCPKIDSSGGIVTPTLPDGEELARLILGDDFLSPEDMAKAYGWSYTDDQLANFAETLPDLETLKWLKSNGGLLQATPPNDCNLIQVSCLNNKNKVSYYQSEVWYAKGEQKFARNDVVKSGEWLMVRKEPYPDSHRKTWDEQLALLSGKEQVPNAPEMAYAVTAYFKVRDVYLLQDVYVRTSSIDADGVRVIVSCFSAGSLNVYNCYDGSRGNIVGVSSSRKSLNSLNT